MKDREGYEYHVMTLGTVFVCILSPARQAKKATGLHGRQYVKYRKAQRRVAKRTIAKAA